MAGKLYFIINQKGKVADVMMAADEQNALKQALKKGEDYTVELVTSKNWKRLAEKFGEIVEGARDYDEVRDSMTNLFEAMGMPSSEVKEAARGRYLDATKTLAVLGLKPKDFKDLDDVEPSDLEESSAELPELTEAEADEALRRARTKLGLSDVDLVEQSDGYQN
jgi:ribosome-binding protein aMBF1 (putative translation factor)